MRKQQQGRNNPEVIIKIIGLSLLIIFIVIAAAILLFGVVLIVGLLFMLILVIVLAIKYKLFNNVLHSVQPVKPPQPQSPTKGRKQTTPPPSPGYEQGYKAKTSSRSSASTTTSYHQEQPKQDHPRDYDQPQAQYPQQQ